MWIVYQRTPANMQRLVDALQPHRPYLRGAPPGLPFLLGEHTIHRGLNFTLITGGGSYQDLLPYTIVLNPFGIQCRCLSLARLIHVKRAAGRPKDLEAIAELEAILEERGEE